MELFVTACCSNENDPSLIGVEAGLMLKILAKHMLK